MFYKKFCHVLFFLGALALSAYAQAVHEQDTLPTSAGPVVFTFVGHGSLILQWKGNVIHIDPWSKVGDYSKLPKANTIFLTHTHPDHLDPSALKHIETKDTKYFVNEACAKSLKKGRVMKNGDTASIGDIRVEAIPAYNMVHKMDNGRFWHPKGDGNGYLFMIGDKKIYVAGDTENIPELKGLKNIDVAFLPMNVPYTMTPEMAADAAGSFSPKILYPYHTGETDTGELVKLLMEKKDIEVRIRKMK